jgi:four helix bundle protein
MTITRFKDIRAWQAARDLVRNIYLITKQGELARDFGLRDQLRNAAVSVMSNIAEGFGRSTNADFARFLDVARASANEVQSLLVVCEDVGYLSSEVVSGLDEKSELAIRMIAGFSDYLRNGRVNEPCEDYQS